MARPKKVEEKAETKIEKKKEGFFATSGRRKTAIARIFLYHEKGEFLVNEKPFNEYFSSEEQKLAWLRPFHVVGVSHPQSDFGATIKVAGSGKNSQFDATVLAISKALSMYNSEYSLLLRKQGFLTRDSREVERKKPYLRKARKAPQYSKR